MVVPSEMGHFMALRGHHLGFTGLKDEPKGRLERPFTRLCWPAATRESGRLSTLARYGTN